jgi:hypothetical protein
MRVGLVRNVGLSISALAVLALGACDDNPLSFDVKDTTAIFSNPSVMIVPAGRTAKLESRSINAGGEPTFEAVAAAVDPSCGSGAITVVPDPEALDIQPPGLYEVTGGSVLGQTCINLTSGSNTTVVEVTVVTEEIEIVSGPATLRAGETGQIVAQLVDAEGNPVGPYAPEDAAFSSSATGVADFTDEFGNFSTTASGAAVLTVTWSGQEANGTAGLGVERSVDHSLTVLANVPASAEFAAASIPGLGAGEQTTVEVVVLDAEGNQNSNADEITGCTASSSDVLVATATCEVVPGTEPTDPVTIEVTVVAVGPGTADIGGTVLTSEGPLTYGPQTATVIAPSITGLSAASGGYAETVTISGIGLAADGFVTLVFVDDEQLGNFTVVSDTEITAQMPTYADPGAGHLVVVTVGGIPTTEVVTWEQTDTCYANDIPYTPGAPLFGPVVDVSIPLRCNGTATDGDNSNAWFVAPISADALGGGTDVSVNYAPTWGSPLKDIDWYYCGDEGMAPDGPVGSCAFEIDQPPSTVDLDLGVGDHVFMEDDFASYQDPPDSTPQDYTVIVTIN